MVELRLDGVANLDVPAHSTAAACRPSSPAARCGRAGGSTAAKRSGGRFWRRRSILVLSSWTSSGAPSMGSPRVCPFEISSRSTAPSASSFRRTTSIGVPADLESRARAMRGDRCRHDQDRGVSQPGRARRSASRRIAKDGDAVVIGMGELGVASRLLASAVRIALDVRGRRRGARPDAGAPDDRRLRVQARRPLDAHLRRRQHQRAALAVSGDAQRRVSGRGHRRRLRAAAGARLQ